MLRAHMLQVKLNFDSALQSLSEPSTSRIKGATEGSLNSTGVVWSPVGLKFNMSEVLYVL